MKAKLNIIIFFSVIALAMSAGVVANQRVFVSSQTTLGDMGGFAGADAMCQDLADTAGIGGH